MVFEGKAYAHIRLDSKYICLFSHVVSVGMKRVFPSKNPEHASRPCHMTLLLGLVWFYHSVTGRQDDLK